jgi:membrane associated rhomboid family serine protease
MFPVSDVIPSRTTPYVTITLIALNAIAFAIELLQSDAGLHGLVFTYGVVPANFSWPDVLTSMFLHSGWLHFLGNMLYLWIFGDNVEDRLGHARYLLFYLFCGAVAAFGQTASHPSSTLPMIGASGAIAGVMGAYFVLYPHSRVLALVPLFIIWEIIEVPAIFFLGIWFLMQFFSGVGSLVARGSVESGGIAFWAHIAGFVAGVAGVLVLRKPSRSRWAT